MIAGKKKLSGIEYSGKDITVVIPSHNSHYYIRKALKSIEAQTERPKEIIIIDNGSSKASRDSLLDLIPESSIPIRLEFTEFACVSNARNIGYSLVTTKLIAMLDSDDYYENDFLNLALHAFNLYENLSLFFGNRISIDSNQVMGSPFLEKTILASLDYTSSERGINLIIGDLRSSLLRGNFISCSGAVVSKYFAYKTNLFPVGLTSSEDRVFFYNLAGHGSVAYTYRNTHFYYQHDNSISNRSDFKRLAENGLNALKLIYINSNNRLEKRKISEEYFRQSKVLLYQASEQGLISFFSYYISMNNENLSAPLQLKVLLKATIISFIKLYKKIYKHIF